MRYSFPARQTGYCCITAHLTLEVNSTPMTWEKNRTNKYNCIIYVNNSTEIICISLYIFRINKLILVTKYEDIYDYIYYSNQSHNASGVSNHLLNYSLTRLLYRFKRNKEKVIALSTRLITGWPLALINHVTSRLAWLRYKHRCMHECPANIWNSVGMEWD